MAKLSLNKAAKRAGVAKSTLLEALNSNDVTKKVSAEKNSRGHWEIDESELDRVFERTSSNQSRELMADPPENHQKPPDTSALEQQVKALREQVARMDETSAREREQAAERIEDLRVQLNETRTDHRQALAAITDQRPRKKFLGIF